MTTNATAKNLRPRATADQGPTADPMPKPGAPSDRPATSVRPAVTTAAARLPAALHRATEATRAHAAKEPGAIRDLDRPPRASPARRAAAHAGEAPAANSAATAPARPSVAESTPVATPAPAVAAPPLPATLEPLLDGARGAVNPSSAHLRLDAGTAGELALHLRLRGGVADVRVEGDGAQALANRSAELSRALAAEGISLRRLEADAPAAPAQGHAGASDTSPRGGTGGGAGSASGGDRGRPGDPERRDAREHLAVNRNLDPVRRPTLRAGLDVEA